VCLRLSWILCLSPAHPGAWAGGFRGTRISAGATNVRRLSAATSKGAGRLASTRCLAAPVGTAAYRRRQRALCRTDRRSVLYAQARRTATRTGAGASELLLRLCVAPGCLRRGRGRGARLVADTVSLRKTAASAVQVSAWCRST